MPGSRRNLIPHSCDEHAYRARDDRSDVLIKPNLSHQALEPEASACAIVYLASGECERRQGSLWKEGDL